MKRSQSFPLRLSPEVMEQAQQAARQEQVSLNHFICLAIAEKLSRLEYDCWEKRARGASRRVVGTALRPVPLQPRTTLPHR